MINYRLPYMSTMENLRATIELCEDDRTESVMFFASGREPTENFEKMGGLEVNLPIVSILALGRIYGPVRMAVIGDCTDFLVASRQPRISEIREATDKAVESGKAFFSPETAPFTAHLDTDDAINTLFRMKRRPLTNESLSDFRAMLSSHGW